MTRRTNYYPANCWKCGVRVNKDEGFLSKGSNQWHVICRPCDEKLEKYKAEATALIASLGSQAYRDASRGK